MGPFGKLPDSLVISGIEYPIKTDFRLWIRLPELDDLRALFMDREPSFYGYFSKESIAQIVGFYAGGISQEKEATAEPDAEKHDAGPAVVDFREDEAIIYASFLQAYGIDLYEVDYLHWWKFKALITGIPEGTTLGQLMQLRSYDGDDKEMKKLRDKVALKRPLSAEEAQAGDLFEEVFG